MDVTKAIAMIGTATSISEVTGYMAGSFLPEGRESQVRTAKGTKIDTRFSVAEATDLIASHTADGSINPDFPQELQPRDRSRDSSKAWIQKTAKDLDPGLLGRTKKADSGAPIIGSDRIVESGNGRTLAIMEAYRIGAAEEYRNWLIEDAEMYGFTAEKIRAMSQPVLVRVRTSKINRKEFAVEANQDDKLAMTATEKAKADAGRLTPDLMSRFSPGEDGDLLVAANRPFIMGFLQSLGDAEAAQYSTKSGEPTGTLIARIQAAVFAKAYEDERLLELMADTAKPENANLVKALAAAAPEFILARESNENGAQEASSQLADSIGLSLDNEAVRTLIDAANIVRQAKRENMGVAEYVSQMGLFGDIDPGVAAMAVFIAQNNRSSKRLGVAFKAMAQFVRRELEHGSSFDMFGERTVSMADVVLAANNAIEKEYGEGKFSIGTPNPQPGSLFESAIDDAANKAATSPTNSLPDPSQAQYESGNYRKGHISLYGLRISIENPRGSTRSGTDPDGKEWSIAMSDHYGYINGSEGADGDHVDVYVGKANNSDMVYVVDQIDQKTGRFDEHKVMLGYRSKKQATDAYKRNFTAGWRVGEVTGAPVDVFKEWLDSGKTRMPFIKFVQSKGKKARRIFEAAEHYGSIDTGLFA